MELNYVWALPGLHLPLVFRMCYSGTLIFRLQYGWAGNVGEFTLLLSSEGKPITIPTNLVGL